MLLYALKSGQNVLTLREIACPEHHSVYTIVSPLISIVIVCSNWYVSFQQGSQSNSLLNSKDMLAYLYGKNALY